MFVHPELFRRDRQSIIHCLVHLVVPCRRSLSHRSNQRLALPRHLEVLGDFQSVQHLELGSAFPLDAAQLRLV
jgi:hypothetical protein